MIDQPAVDNIGNKMKTKLRFNRKRATAALALLHPSPYITVIETGVNQFGSPEYTATGIINKFKPYDEK